MHCAASAKDGHSRTAHHMQEYAATSEMIFKTTFFIFQVILFALMAYPFFPDTTGKTDNWYVFIKLIQGEVTVQVLIFLLAQFKVCETKY